MVEKKSQRASKKSQGSITGGTARRAAVIKGAVELLAQRGAHGLTHRALDQHLSWPTGTTSNYFGRRNDLLIAVAQHIVGLNSYHFAFADFPERPAGVSLEAFIDEVVALFKTWQQPAHRNRMMAGAEILLEARRNPEVEQALVVHFDRDRQLYKRIFKQLGARNPMAATHCMAMLFASMYMGTCVTEPLPSLTQLRKIVEAWTRISMAQ